MARTKLEDRIRLNMSLSPAVKDRIDRLRELAECEDMSEVIRRALFVYEQLLLEQKKGGRLLVRKRDGTDGSLLVT